MSYKWTLSLDADAEILRQTHWYLVEVADGGRELASRWNSSLEVALNELAKRPHMHSFAPENG